MLRWFGSDKSYFIKFVSISQHSYFVVAAVFGVDQPTFDMKTRTIRIGVQVSGDDFFSCNVLGIKLSWALL